MRADMGDITAVFRYMKTNDVLFTFKIYSYLLTKFFKCTSAFLKKFLLLKNTPTHSTLMAQQIMGDDTLKGLTCLTKLRFLLKFWF